MKQLCIFIFCLLVLLASGFYYVQQKKHTTLFDKHLIDHIHAQKTNAFFEQADAYKYAQDYLRARVAFRNLLSEANNADDSIYTYNQLIYCHLAVNEDDLAGQNLHELDVHFPDVEKRGPSVLGDYFYNKGVFAYRIFHPKEAEAYLQKALVQYENVYGEQHLKTAACLTELGMLNFDFFHMPKQMSDYLLRAYDIFQGAPQLMPFSAANELGMALSSYMNRNHEIAQAHCENALFIAQSTPLKDTVLMARAQSYRGQMLKKKAEAATDVVFKKRLLDSAETEFQQAIRFLNKPMHPRTQELYRNILVFYIYKKDVNGFNNQLDTLNKIVSNSRNYFAFQDRLKGYFHYYKNDTAQTIAYYKSFLDKHYNDSLCSPALKEEAFWALTKIYNKTNLFDSTIYYISLWMTHDKKARIDLDNYAQHQKTSVIYAHYYVPLEQLGLAYFKKYKQLNHIEDLKKSVKAYCLADSLLSKRLAYDEGNTTLNLQFAVGRYLYHGGLEAVYALYEKNGDPKLLDVAFLFCERMKSSILFRDLKVQANNDSIKDLKHRFDKLIGEREVSSKSDVALSSVLTRTSRLLEAQFKSSGIADSMTIPSVKTLRQHLGEGQAVIEYYSGQPTFALYISREKMLFHKIDNKDSLLDKNIAAYRNSLAQLKTVDIKKAEMAFSNAAFSLYSQLLKPFAPFLDKQKEVVIIPDTDLHNIPFEGFVTHQQWTGYKNAPYVIKKNYTLSYAPSWKIYTQSLGKKRPSSYKAVCFSYGEGQSDLDCSPKEIDAISTILGKNNVNSLDFGRCTAAHFMQEWQKGNYDILHLSLHAKGSLSSIFDNKIWFDNAKKDFLYGFDLSGKKSTIPLIVLSACETGLGNAPTGEGAYSLSRYFFQAGATTVLAALWKIDDCQSAAITASFYQNIKNGQQPKQALCDAKRLFLATPKDDNLLYHPNLWAGTICLE